MTSKRWLLAWLAITVALGFVIHIVYAIELSASLAATAHRLRAAEAEFPMNLLANGLFRACLVEAVPVCLGAATSAVLVGGFATCSAMKSSKAAH